MFENWTFLIGEIWVLLGLAALLGLLSGWIIWGRSGSGETKLPVPSDQLPENAELTTSSEPPLRDNLTAIKGLGPKLEATCNDLDIYRFEQIANWTPTEIAKYDALLKGRVTRDNWVGQAQSLLR